MRRPSRSKHSEAEASVGTCAFCNRNVIRQDNFVVLGTDEVLHDNCYVYTRRKLANERRNTIHSADANADSNVLPRSESKNRVAGKNNIEYIALERPETSGRAQEAGNEAKGARCGKKAVKGTT